MGGGMALAIQCTPLVVHSAALEAREEIKKVVLADGVLWPRLWR